MELAVIELAGTAAQMGEQFGEACRAQIGELCDRRVRAARDFARQHGGRDVREDHLLDVARRCLPIAAAWDAAGHDEFLGIARGAGVEPEMLYAMQALTDLRDLLACGGDAEGEGCSAFFIGRDRAAGGHVLCGQTWDLATENMPFVRLVHRRPTDGPQTWSVTLTGCLTLIGLSEAGLAMGTTNLKTTDARVGVEYQHVLHRAIRCNGLDEATQVVTQAPRLGGHYYWLADAAGRAAGIACSATRSHVKRIDHGTMVHCNHALVPAIRELEAPMLSDSTFYRQERMDHLIAAHPGPIGVEDLKGMLADHEGGDRAICRHDVPPYGISTNACAIISPGTGEIHACRGQAHVGRWRTAKIDRVH